MSFTDISRKKAEHFLKNVGTAINNPSDNPLLHYAYGIGGIGKSTLIDKIIETHKSSFQFAKCFFGVNSHINTPIVRVQDVGLSGKNDPIVLEWAAQERRILLTHDVATITRYAYERLAKGKSMPGVIEVT